MNRLKQLSKDSVIYGLGGVLGKGVSFFLLPIYTRIFTPSDYGNIEMMSVIISLLSVILSIGLDSAQSFFFFEQRPKGKEAQAEMITSILQWRIFWGVIIVLIAGGLSPLLNAWFFGGKLTWVYFAISFSSAFFGMIMNQSLEIFRLQYKAWTFIIITIANTLLASALILTFVIFLNLGILGYFLGSAIAAFATAFLGWWIARSYIRFSIIHYSWWPRLIKFGLPLLPAELGFFVMNTSDRWFVRHYMGEESLGIFSIAAKFAILMAFAIDMFRKAWWPLAMDAMHSEDGKDTFRTIARLYMGLGSAAVVYLTFLSPWLVKILTTSSYYSAYSIIGIMAWQPLFYGFYLIGSAGIWKVEKTYITSILMCLTGLLNIFLNYLWVPVFGAIGAAIANSVAYFVWIMVSIFISERLWRVNFNIYLLLAQIGIGAAIVVFLYNIPEYTAITIILVHLIVAVLVFSSINAAAKKMILQKIKKYKAEIFK
ncbi:MAG: oligosaccharide flippase family protein [Chitinophagaceae bacterium]|nr:oligosaccharide flippase family protein [Chitinophagaceae bacterium]